MPDLIEVFEDRRFEHKVVQQHNIDVIEKVEIRMDNGRLDIYVNGQCINYHMGSSDVSLVLELRK